ncbi:MAG: RAMP superfamily CRISPR-associated protein [Anaerolineae bacterium]
MTDRRGFRGEEDLEERAPQPYAYVPLPRGQPPKALPVKGDGHRLESRGLLAGQLQGIIVALTPVHVASGKLEMTEEIDPQRAEEIPLVKGFVRSGGRRVIPASSLKGTIRSIAEAITFSCVGVAALGTFMPIQFRECRFDPAHGHAELCTACRMFGAPGYMGQVRFSDAVQVEGGSQVMLIPILHIPQRQRRGRRFYFHGRPASGDVPVEVCPAGSRFRFDLQFENLRVGELGVLLIALGQGEPQITPKLGGGKPACLGSVRMEVESLTLRGSRRQYLDYDAPEGGKSAEMAKYIAVAQRAKNLLFREGLQRLGEVLHYDEERECPSGGY